MSQTGPIPVVGRRRRFRASTGGCAAPGSASASNARSTRRAWTSPPASTRCTSSAASWASTSSSVLIFAPFFGLLAALLGLWGGNYFLNYQIGKRTEAFINQLPELTRVLANATQAGLALRTAIAMAAEELDNPAGEEFRKVADQLAVGRSLDDALNELAERLPSRELTVLVSTLILSNRAGGTIVSSLRNLTDTLEERKETRREVTTLLSQVKVTAVAVPLLGFGFLLILNGMRDGALDDMTNATAGKVAVVIASGLYGLGFFLINRLTRVRI